ncbi:MAG TPA: acetate/propionate family kinase [Roseiarcus sp.]|nr:acetate/propionate family kinase [Roseiarcus sp.]
MSDHVLTLNAGSSSIKFALFAVEGDWPRRIAHGLIEEIGGCSRFRAEARGREQELPVVAPDHASAIRSVFDWVDEAFPEIVVAAIGHRVVHGGLAYSAPAIVDANMLAELAALAPLAPLHQPHNLVGVAAAHAAYPSVPQVACFDTAFHRGHQFVNDAYALPRDYYARGLRRFGFHGLSYEFIAHRLRAIDPVLACGRVIVAHLGAGASLCAMKDGRSVASTMGFSALEGLAMATRCGEIDPGLLLYLLDHERMTVAELTRLLYERSGLKGLSGISGDMRTLEESDAPEAKDAIAYFTHRVRMHIGALAATLGGLDALVFTAGIGEHSARVRRDVCSGMNWLGLRLDAEANARGDARIGDPTATAQVLLLATDEEPMIARHTIAVAGVARQSVAA